MMNNEFEKFFFNKMFFGNDEKNKFFFIIQTFSNYFSKIYLKKKTFKIMIFSKL